jgi:2-polyprenyl-3-methyl-5-hydroxy-6-metoxy-1,4-benzoquinol methylase
MTLTDRNECPLCRRHENDIYIPFPGIPVVQCRSCSFTYSSRILSEQSLNSYYVNNFGSQRHLQGQIVNAKINAWAITRLLNIQDISNILDVGSGYGFLLQELCKHFQLDATGVELSRQEASFAKSKLGLNVINLSLGESGLEKENYDLVTSFEVIEHISNPVEFIREMTQYVRLNGYLLIMTDNFHSHMAQFLGPGFPKWIPHSHISHFSPGTLKKAIEKIKELTIIKTMSYTPWEVLLRAAYYRLRGIKKSPSESFDLASVMESEMKGEYKLFALRKLINKAWAQLTLSEKMDGDLMYFLARRTVNK